MPRYVITDGTFNPFTYEQLALPAEQSAQAHLAANEAMDDLAMKAGDIGSQIGDDPEKNRRLRAMYDGYMKSLSAAQDALYRNGYTTMTGRSLSDARRRYATDMGKVRGAFGKWSERVKAFRDAKAKDPTLLSSRDPYLDDVDLYLGDSVRDVDSYSGAMLTAQAEAAAKEARRDFATDPEWSSKFGMYYQIKEGNGFTISQIDEAKRTYDAYLDGTAQLHTQGPLAALEGIIDKVYRSSNVGVWADDATRKRAVEYIVQGLYPSIGDVKTQVVNDQSYIDPYSSWKMNNGSRSGGQGGAQGQDTSALYYGSLDDRMEPPLEGGEDRRRYDDFNAQAKALDYFIELAGGGYDFNGIYSVSKNGKYVKAKGVDEGSFQNVVLADELLHAANILSQDKSIVDVPADVMPYVLAEAKKLLAAKMDSVNNMEHHYRPISLNGTDTLNGQAVRDVLSANVGAGANDGAITWGPQDASHRYGEKVTQEDIERIAGDKNVKLALDQSHKCVLITSRLYGELSMPLSSLRHITVPLNAGTVKLLKGEPDIGERAMRRIQSLEAASQKSDPDATDSGIVLDGEEAAEMICDAAMSAGSNWYTRPHSAYGSNVLANILMQCIWNDATTKHQAQAQTGKRDDGAGSLPLGAADMADREFEEQ